MTAMSTSSAENARAQVIRVLIADDHAVVSNGLRMLLSGEPDLEVVATADDGALAVALAAQERPDVVVMDLTMPTLGGVEATRQMQLLAPGTRVLILSGRAEQAVVRAAYAAGASGYLSKDVAALDLLDAIRRTHAGVFSVGAA
jgi:DNA-binding NarL/FixJ family response regulator